jgi:hypothetical protein
VAYLNKDSPKPRDVNRPQEIDQKLSKTKQTLCSFTPHKALAQGTFFPALIGSLAL